MWCGQSRGRGRPRGGEAWIWFQEQYKPTEGFELRECGLCEESGLEGGREGQVKPLKKRHSHVKGLKKGGWPGSSKKEGEEGAKSY